MRRKRKNESCECFLFSEARNVFAQIRRKIKRVSVDAIDDGSFNMSRPIEWPIWMDDGRARDNWNPLLHIAMAAGARLRMSVFNARLTYSSGFSSGL